MSGLLKSFNGVLIIFISCLFLVCFVHAGNNYWKQNEDKIKCPKVKGLVNFDISKVSFNTFYYFIKR